MRRLEAGAGRLQFLCKEGNDPRPLLRRRLFCSFRRHGAKIKLIDNFLIPLKIVELCNGCRQPIESPISLLRFCSMTLNTVVGQKGRDFLVGTNRGKGRD